MDILYLSSLCSTKEYERMFEIYGSTSSHASQKFNRLMVQGLVENGCSVEALTERIIINGKVHDLIRAEETENGIRYIYLPRYTNRKINRIMTIWNAFKYICKWSKEHHDGVILCDIILGELSIAVWMASKIRRIKTAAIVTDVPNIRAGEERKGIKALPIKIKNIFITSYKSYVFLTEQMNTKLNPKNKPYVIIEGLVDDKVLYQPNTIDGKYSEKVIVMAGLLEDIFGVDVLLRAFMQVECEDARLKFYGKGSSTEKIIEASNIDNRISYCGELTNNQIVKEEKKATLLINPRPPIGEWTAYSFPSKNMEYMASGTPLVAFDLPCIPEEYKSFFYQIEEYSVTAMSDLLHRLLNMSSLELHDFGIRAQTWVVNMKNPKIQVKKFIQLINNALK